MSRGTTVVRFSRGGSVRTLNAWMIVAFCTTTAVATIAVAALGLPDQLFMLLLAPILLAAPHPARYVYVTMLGFLSVCVFMVTENYRLPITDSTVTVCVTLLMMVIACEAIRFTAQRQVRLSNRLAESEERLRAFWENAPDAIFVVDENGCITESNESACTMTGHKRETLIGSRFNELCGDEQPIVLDADCVHEWKGQLRGANGSTLSVEISLRQFILQGGTSWIAMARDVEERILAEADLRRSEAIRESIIESTSDYLMMLDLDYRIQYINRTVPDLTVEAVLGHSVHEYEPPDSVEASVAVYERIRQTRQPGTLETTYISTDDGKESYFESRVAPILQDGEVAGFIVSASDVTDRRRQEAEQLELECSLLRSQKLESLGLLAGGIAHDFNNLLVAIMGRADIAREDAGNRERIEEHLGQIVDASQHAASLCKQLLAYSGKGRFRVAPTNLSRLVSETRKLLEISVPDNVRIAYELTETRFVVEADDTQLRQVVMNLVTNASEALQPRGGDIRIRTGVEELGQADLLKHVRGEILEDGLYAYLEVEDTGSGMTAETMERLFDPFFTTKSEGTGLGMAAVLGIVRGHAGAMSVTSNEEHGTTIRVVLPAQSGIHKKACAETDVGNQLFENSGTILVVDDEPAVRAVAQAILESAKFDVVTADTGQEAIEIFGENRDSIIAVVLDMKMPDMNGEEVMEQLRTLRADLPILLSSGYSEIEVSERTEGVGVSAFLPKPYLATDLIAAINGVLSPAS